VVADELVRETFSRSVEDYLKTIYRLSETGRPASTSQIAEALALAPPSVSGMVKRLSEQGLLSHEPYRGVLLTEMGRLAAVRVVRRHRLIESYLVGRLGYTWDSVHDEAERLEHAVSDELVERMATALGHPEVDPHGDPIPDAKGSVAHPALNPLTDVPLGQVVEVRRVDTNDAERLRYLAAAGLVPGATVSVVERAPFNGPITVEVGGRSRALALDLAAVVLCGKPRE
jgi:DtxR family transcriptional regulator, Mn-dependent transcriptional regulator